MGLARELHSLIFPRFWSNGIDIALGAVPKCPASRISEVGKHKKFFQKPEVLVPQGVMTIPKNLFYFPAVQGRIGRYNWITQANSVCELHKRKEIQMHKVDVTFCCDVLLQLINARHWLSDATNDETPAREIAGYVERIELCKIGIRIFLSNGCKVIWRMARQNAEFISSASLFATKENA